MLYSDHLKGKEKESKHREKKEDRGKEQNEI